MRFDSRLWKLDLENLWWNKNRIQCRDSILNFFLSGKRGCVHLTGNKGAGKSTLTALLSKKLDAHMIRMEGSEEDDRHDYGSHPILFVDEAQKVSQEFRADIRKQNPRAMMTSVLDLSDDGYDLVCKIEPLTAKEVISYVNYHGCLSEFDDEALEELYKASKGHMRLINTICKAALEQPELIVTREVMAWVAKKKFKLRY